MANEKTDIGLTVKQMENLRRDSEGEITKIIRSLVERTGMLVTIENHYNPTRTHGGASHQISVKLQTP